MTLLYCPRWSYTYPGHTSIRNLSFSPDGTYLAYGSGGDLCIMTVIDKQPILVVRGRETSQGASIVTALAWVPKEKFRLLCAFQDGLLTTMTYSSGQVHVIGMHTDDSHTPSSVSPGLSITHIAVNSSGTSLATGGDSGITIWASDKARTWIKVKKLGSPLRFQENTQIEVAGLHWLDPKQNQLIAVYKSHGAQLWDVSSGTVIARIVTTSTTIGYSSLSPDYKKLTVATRDGYEIHHVENRVPLTSIAHGISGLGPVMFLRGGRALLGVSSSKEEVCLWRSDNGEKLHELTQDASDIWHAFSAYDKDKLLIAAATSERIVLWEEINKGATEAQVGRRWGWLEILLSTILLTLLMNILIELAKPKKVAWP